MVMASVFLLNRTVIRLSKFSGFLKQLHLSEGCADCSLGRLIHSSSKNNFLAKSPSDLNSYPFFRKYSVLKRVRNSSLVLNLVSLTITIAMRTRTIQKY